MVADGVSVRGGGTAQGLTLLHLSAQRQHLRIVFGGGFG